jgi:MFS family permease
MIEAYAFLAMFIVQILVTSVLLPAWFIRYVRTLTSNFPAERLAQLYPGVDLGDARERSLTQYRALTAGIAVLGLLLLGWLFSYMRRPSWDAVNVNVLITVHFLAAYLLPLLLVAWVGVRFHKKHKRSLPEAKRTASLRRRGLFDFVSPFVVFLAVLSYFLFAAFVIYLQQQALPGFAGLITLGAITLVYALNAFVVYMTLYGKKRNPFETQTGRLHTIGLTVKSSVYSCIVIVVYLSLNFALLLLDLRRWEPFSLSTFFVICALVASMGFAAPLRKPEADGMGSAPTGDS